MRSLLIFTVLLFYGSSSLAQQKCASCHPRQVAAYAKSAMANSLSVVAAQPEGTVHHQRSGSKITIQRNGEQMVQRLESHGLSAEYPVAYAVGDGKVGFSYLIRLGSYFFQSPASYYTQKGGWDLTPGYEAEARIDFTHPISEGCVFCHTGSAQLVAGTDNRYRDPAFTPISCERCHGPSEAHLQRPVPGSIVNPAKLSPAARDSVCEQCHLEGETRILNVGRQWRDFHPGSLLESVFTTYVRRGHEGGRDPQKAVSQSEQLALSKCARGSAGRLWCGTCHDPHSSSTANRPQQVREVCLSCHASNFAEASSHPHPPQEECVSCHMPQLRPFNVAHSSISDHRIVRPGVSHEKAPEAAAELLAWRQPTGELAQRNLGLAYFQLGSSSQKIDELAHSYELLSHVDNARQTDPEVISTLASLLLPQGKRDIAVKLFQQAVALAPANARYAYCLGVALDQNGQTGPAVAELRRSIQLDPSSSDSYLRLAEIYGRLGQQHAKQEVLQEYLRFMPQNLQFRQMR